MDFYIQLEAKKGFRQWTRQGLLFLLSLPELNPNVIKIAKAKLKKLNELTRVKPELNPKKLRS